MLYHSAHVPVLASSIYTALGAPIYASASDRRLRFPPERCFASVPVCLVRSSDVIAASANGPTCSTCESLKIVIMKLQLDVHGFPVTAKALYCTHRSAVDSRVVLQVLSSGQHVEQRRGLWAVSQGPARGTASRQFRVTRCYSFFFPVRLPNKCSKYPTHAHAQTLTVVRPIGRR